MFDSTGLFHFTISGRPCVVRWPTDAEWCERSRRCKIVQTVLSGGRTKSDAPDLEKVGAELFAKIQQEDGAVGIDEVEAQFVIDRFEWCEVVASEKIGDRFQVSLRVFGPQADADERPLTTHVLSSLTLRELRACSKASVNRVDTRKESITRVALEPVGALYDKRVVEVVGYAPNVRVPIIHKDAVITEILRLLHETMIDFDPER
ncbi:MAG: hypothetical protein QM757_26715 [Paludibaculum sp.]